MKRKGKEKYNKELPQCLLYIPPQHWGHFVIPVTSVLERCVKYNFLSSIQFWKMKGFSKEQGCHELFSVQYCNKLQKMFRLLIIWYVCSSLPTVNFFLFRTSLDTLVFLKHGSMKDSRDNFSSSPFEIHPVFIPGQG